MPCGKFGTFFSSFCTLTNSVHCNTNWLLCSLPRLNSKILNFQIIILDALLVVVLFLHDLQNRYHEKCGSDSFDYQLFSQQITVASHPLFMISSEFTKENNFMNICQSIYLPISFIQDKIFDIFQRDNLFSQGLQKTSWSSYHNVDIILRE